MVLQLAKDPSARLLKHVVRCYLRLSDNPRFVEIKCIYNDNVINSIWNINRAREALRQCLPDQLRDSTFAACLQEDKSTKHWLALLITNLEPGSAAPPDPRQLGLSPLAS